MMGAIKMCDPTPFTHTNDSISSVSLVTGTGEATRSVGTGSIITPRAHARARGYVIGRGVYYILYIYILYICKDFFLSFKILTFRRPFQHRKASLRI